MSNNMALKFNSTIWSFIDKNRGALPFSELYIIIVYVLYGIHKQYKVDRAIGTFRFDDYADDLLQDLLELCKNNLSVLDPYNFYIELTEFPREFFEKYYVVMLSSLMEYEVSNSGRKGGEFYSPSEINKLIAYFVNNAGINSVYDPFCGSASLVRYLEDNAMCFVGQDIYNRTTILARVNVDARYGMDKGISCGNSILNWNRSHFDAVVTCPPLNMRLSLAEMNATNVGDGARAYNVEDIVFLNAVNHNHARIIILLAPINFSYSLNHKWIRQYLIDRNLLDTIIFLPENLLYGTSVPCSLIVCRADRKDNAPIKLMDASAFGAGDSFRKKYLDYNKLISAYESDNELYCVNATTPEILANDYNLNIHLYNQVMVELEDGQQIYLLGSLMEESKRYMANPDEDYMVFSSEYFSSNIIDIMLNKDKLVHLQDDESATPKRLIKVTKGKKYLLYLDGYRTVPRLAIYTGQENILCPNNVKAFEVREEIVSPEYLAYLIINNPVLRKSYGSIYNYMTIQVVVDSNEKQKEMLFRLSQQHTARMQEEQEADAKRLGVKLNISDMEHMLGTPKMKIDSIIEDLEDFMPSQENYQEVVKALKDNIDYMFRLIHFNNASMNTEAFNITPNNLQAYLDQYAKAWYNYGGNYFNLTVKNELESGGVLNFDKLLFTVMFDAILSNAVRHGFMKRKDFTPDNRVEIATSVEKYDGKPYVVFRFSNNGNPMSKNFTLNDYVTRGRYSATSGRSGLGGYHVYQIAKAHNGFLYLDSNKVWNMVVEVLIPVDNVEPDNLIEYEHECI
jgi:type I restriction-modification system DNA methylase subunit